MDAGIFNTSADGRYELARALDGYGALTKETRLSDEILGTSRSFDMLVNNAQYIRHAQKENVLKIIQNGANVRILLWGLFAGQRSGVRFVQLGDRPEPRGIAPGCPQRSQRARCLEAT